MDRSDAARILPIIIAFANGKKVQFRHPGCSTWKDVDDPSFNLDPNNYRIKPEPKEVWVNEYPYGASYIYTTKDYADRSAQPDRSACIHYRQVIED